MLAGFDREAEKIRRLPFTCVVESARPKLAKRGRVYLFASASVY